MITKWYGIFWNLFYKNNEIQIQVIQVLLNNEIQIFLVAQNRCLFASKGYKLKGMEPKEINIKQ